MNEMKSPTILSIKFFPALAMMGIKVIPDHVNIPLGISFSQGIHEDFKILRRARWGTIAKDLSSGWLQGSDQAARAVPDVFILQPLDTCIIRSVKWVFSFKCLHAGLFIDADNPR